MLMSYFHTKFHSLAHYLSQQDNPSGQLACCCFTSHKNYPNQGCIFFFENPFICISGPYVNPLNAGLNPFGHLLALLEAHHILHVSRMTLPSQKFRCQSCCNWFTDTKEWSLGGNQWCNVYTKFWENKRFRKLQYGHHITWWTHCLYSLQESKTE